jgi:uncharacterized YkwD family protein
MGKNDKTVKGGETMRKGRCACKFIYCMVILALTGVLLTVPAYAAVSYRSDHYRTRLWNWYGWPIANRPGIPSLPWSSQPVRIPAPNQNVPDNSGANNSALDLTSDESYILKQVNIERAKAGLAPLQIDYSLVQTARVKSRDMINYGYFDHQSPTLGSPFDQMNKAGISYHNSGENIAGNPSAVGAMSSWMNSPGHRANILNPKFNRIGIGVVNGGPYGKMLTQQFIG